MVDRKFLRWTVIALALTVAACDDVPSVAFEPQEQVVQTPGAEHTMVLVPEGVFTMGTESGRDDESPIHQVHIDEFYIDKVEVTNAQYDRFVEATGSSSPVYSVSPLFNAPTQPVVGITWDEAQAYCEWAGLRLPTEAEWEKAARGTEQQTFPWGDDLPSRTRVRFLSEEGPVSVGIFPDGASPYGALDMAGNVWEYVRDHYVADFYFSSPDRNPVAIVDDSEIDHTIRGGGWGSQRNDIRTTARGRVFLIEVDQPDSHVGFRCAM